MGQYYTPILTQDGVTTLFSRRTAIVTERDKIEIEKDSYYNFNGAKILEHSWWNNDLVRGVIGNVYNKPGRIAWVGDYTDDIMDEVTSNDGTVAPMKPIELYSRCVYQKDDDDNLVEDERGYHIQLEDEPLPEDVIKNELVEYNPDFTLDNKVAINLTSKEFLDCNEYYKRSLASDGWCINPIPLLTSTGGDQGGGDYHSENVDAQEVGRWAYDEIVIKDLTDETLEELRQNGFEELTVTFKEGE